MWPIFTTVILMVSVAKQGLGQTADYQAALKRAQYLLNATIPTETQVSAFAGSDLAYKQAVRGFLDHSNFYDVVLRYHEKVLGVGLPKDYMDELLRDEIDNKVNKLARISCERSESQDQRFRCFWSSRSEESKVSSCTAAEEQAVNVFWYSGVVAWACPTVVTACGPDLSRCFIEYNDENVARNSELGATEAFDSRFSVIKSLSRQSAGLATAVVIENYPYTRILEPGLTAIDGAVAHFYRQGHHFDLDRLNLSPSLLQIADQVSLTDTRFRLVFTGASYEQGGIVSTFGWLRRYEKNRTRANQLYERLLCRQFTSELPRVFPQDPGNLRETPGCEGCHATLDPLADFFLAWGEGGDLYGGGSASVTTTFNGQAGSYVSDLANIVRTDNAFATCTVENVWKWLMGRKFYTAEANVRAALTNYFVTTNYSFKELVYALTTHPAFLVGERSDAVVGDPLQQPPLGEPPGGSADQPCPDTEITFAANIQPRLSECSACHNNSSEARQDLTTLDSWRVWGSQAVNMMASGNMPPGQAGPPRIGSVYEFKEDVRCWLEQEEQN